MPDVANIGGALSKAGGASFDLVRSWVAASLHSTIYASLGVALGAAMQLIANARGSTSWSWFWLGMCILPGPLYLYNVSDRRFRAGLVFFKQLLADGLITQEIYDANLKRAADWRGDRLYGAPPVLAPAKQPAAAKQPKAPKPAAESASATVAGTGEAAPA